MARFTPFHPRTSELCHSFAWKEWAGYNAVCNYDRHSEREYYAIRHTAGLIDVTPLYKCEVTGPDAGLLLSRVWCRDISKIGVGRVVYSAMCDERGMCLDDGTIARLSKEHYRVSTTESWYRWHLRFARGLDVQVEDSTDRIAAVALQGPAARKILKPIVEFDMDRMRFFRVRRTNLGNIPLWISRTGYTGDLGYELWVENQHALPLWDALIEAGKIHGLEPFGLDALDVSRIEAGFVLQGVDYISAKQCLIESRKSTPTDAGLGWTVELEDRDPFVGQSALLQEKKQGPKWGLVGLDISWPAVEVLYDEYGLPPHLAPVSCRLAVPIYDKLGQKQVGQATSTTWSPTLKKYLALGQVYDKYTKLGTELRIEHTVEFNRRQLPATVIDKPFFDPKRKKFTPAAAKKKAS
ncbi:MAG: aminomethyl transferase family protein [Proteobacteria bacterium]|nr:aminomethyl transferase family protein [Pseudomonadota bacterium]